MDPEETLELLKDAIRDNEPEEAAEHYQNMRAAMEDRGGYDPTWDWDQSTLEIFMEVTYRWLSAEGML